METYGLVDREGWAPGPWDGEPDLVEFRSSVGLACRAARPHAEIGCWCGYVEVPLEHPWFGVGQGELPEIDVHGGITFADSIGEGWWIGFDCGHFMDVAPGMDALLTRLGRDPIPPMPAAFTPTYKDLAYVRAECNQLAWQVHARRQLELGA